MNFRKNSTLIVGCSIAAVLLVLATFFLIQKRSAYSTNSESYTAAKNRLDALNTRNPYPSDENVKLAQQNLDLLSAKYADAHNSLISNQLMVETIEPARFAPLLEEAFRRVRNRAVTNNVTLPAEPGLGFKDYMMGKLPPNDSNVMARLIIQVKSLEDLITLLIDSKVASIDLLQRDDFENRLGAATPAPAPEETGRRGFVSGGEESANSKVTSGGIPPAASSPLYQTERFTIGFTGRESAVWDAMNRLVNSKVVYIVKDVTFESTATNLGKPVDMKAKLQSLAPGGTRPVNSTLAPDGAIVSQQPSMDSISREERVIGGRELIKAKIVVDMYRFTDLKDGGVQP